MCKKRNNKESMIYLTQKKKKSEIIGVSLWPPSFPAFNPYDYAKWYVLENKTNATFHPNIASLKTVIEEEWNKIKCLKNQF